MLNRKDVVESIERVYTELGLRAEMGNTFTYSDGEITGCCALGAYIIAKAGIKNAPSESECVKALPSGYAIGLTCGFDGHVKVKGTICNYEDYAAGHEDGKMLREKFIGEIC